MAFFDDLGKKITHAGQSAVQKTKDVTDLARLNGLITDEEKLMTQHYMQIGKLYFEMHAADSEAQFTDFIRMIIESETKIDELRRQIQTIKGVVRCERCGAEVSQNSAFCNACGAPIPKPQPPAGMVQCTGCGQVIPAESRFCVHCGKPVEVAPQPMPETEGTFYQGDFSNNVFTQPVQPQACPNCGAAVSDGMVFCTVCGTKLQ